MRVEEGEVFKGDGFFFVVAHDVFEHLVGWQGRGGGGVSGEVEAWGTVVGGVGYVEGVGAGGAVDLTHVSKTVG